MRWGLPVVMVAAMLAAGCSDDPPVVSSPPPSPSPSPPPPPSPPPSPVGQPVKSARPYVAPTSAGNLYLERTEIERTILRDLETRVMKQAGAPGRVLGSCDKQTDAYGGSWEQECTIKFDGLEVPFDIVGNGTVLVRWTVSQDYGPLIRAGVHRAWYQRVAKQAPGAVGTAQCDADLPVRSLEPFGDTRYSCWFEADGKVQTQRVTLGESFGIGFT